MWLKYRNTFLLEEDGEEEDRPHRDWRGLDWRTRGTGLERPDSWPGRDECRTGEGETLEIRGSAEEIGRKGCSIFVTTLHMGPGPRPSYQYF